MLVNPRASDETGAPQGNKEEHVLRHRQGKKLQPLSKDLQLPPHARTHHTGKGKVVGSNSAVELIRRKLEAIYDETEPEIQTLATPQPQKSKHQEFMYKLSTSGKPLSQIQTEWHSYYVNLPDTEKHEVWREFYANNSNRSSAYTDYARQHSSEPSRALQPLPKIPGFAPEHHTPRSHATSGRVTVSEHLPNLPASTGAGRTKAIDHIRHKIVDRVITSEESQRKAKQHLHSLAFGIGTGLVVLLILLFGFFNEMFIAPFIQPSRHVSATPIIINPNSIASSENPEVIIPKINVQIPVVYDEASTDEKAIQTALERGVVHYSSTVNPGEQGNVAIFGHSSNNIFNKGKYKFAFVLLHDMVPGDIFYLVYNNTVYTYKVFDKKIVPPTEISVMNGVAGKVATATLITCDPPGTSANRLVVWGEQISPDPAGASAPAAGTGLNTQVPAELPSEGPTLWRRFWNWVF